MDHASRALSFLVALIESRPPTRIDYVARAFQSFSNICDEFVGEAVLSDLIADIRHEIMFDKVVERSLGDDSGTRRLKSRRLDQTVER
jgi:hypothetical protein